MWQAHRTQSSQLTTERGAREGVDGIAPRQRFGNEEGAGVARRGRVFDIFVASPIGWLFWNEELVEVEIERGFEGVFMYRHDTTDLGRIQR